MMGKKLVQLSKAIDRADSVPVRNDYIIAANMYQ